ncbi:MAG: hypothetical protein ABMB14_17985 [Myxococcota bacterium]
MLTMRPINEPAWFDSGIRAAVDALDHGAYIRWQQGDPVDSQYPHTQLGTRQDGSKAPTSRRVEFGDGGKPVKDIDFTNRGRKDHTSPHEHNTWRTRPVRSYAEARSARAAGGGMSVEFPMWKHGQKRLLDVVLSRVPNGLHWRLRWFDGVVRASYGGAPPMGCHIDLAVSDAELRRLAASLEDLNDVVLSASSVDGVLHVECEDSDRWVIRGSGSLAAVENMFHDLGG